MGSHLIDGEFQSDKYPSTPRGKLPLSFKDPAAQPLIAEYARRRREGNHGSKEVDAEFAADVEEALRLAGYTGRGPDVDAALVILKQILGMDGAAVAVPSSDHLRWVVTRIRAAIDALAGQP